MAPRRVRGKLKSSHQAFSLQIVYRTLGKLQHLSATAGTTNCTVSPISCDIYRLKYIFMRYVRPKRAQQSLLEFRKGPQGLCLAEGGSAQCDRCFAARRAARMWFVLSSRPKRRTAMPSSYEAYISERLSDMRETRCLR
jgi:hypothetical protein